MEKEIIYPRFISDKPLGKDLLEGGSHDKIAESISKYIENDSTGIKLIGLEGSWGSGKSNVIEILKNKFLKNQYQFFVFDAWGHQEDLQRRAILEEITFSLIESKTLPEMTTIDTHDKQKKEILWKDLLKDLLARKREIRSKEIPHLSTGLILLISMLIMTPIFKAIGDSFGSKLVLKILITSLPLIVCSTWICCLWRKNKITLSDLYAVYNNKKLENTVFESISENEPTVSEFRKWMNHLSRDLATNEKKLVIVIDNMDRLLPIKVKALWSSIHTFFAECNYPNIWVIVPFDREQIRDAFRDQNFENIEKTNHFINKTFSGIYRISPPILTDWHKLFELKYKEAFSETENDEYDFVKSTFDLTQKDITPRHIISFINDIVSEKKLVGCEVSLRYIAVFSAFKKEILQDPINQILNPTYLGPVENLFREDAKLSDSIASLVYNLPYESAKQITLIQHLKITLREGNLNVINEYAKQRFFLEMLEKVINQEEVQLDNAITTIGSIDKDLIKNLNPKKLEVIWEILLGKQLTQNLNHQVFTQHLKLLFINSTLDKKERIVKYFVNQISNFKEFNGRSFYNSLFEFESFIINQGYSIDMISVLTPMSKTPEIFLNYLGAAGKYFTKYKLTCNEKELMDFIITKIPTELPKLNNIKYLTSTFDLSKVVEKIEQSISNEEITKDNLIQVFDIYKTISKSTPLKLISDSEILSLCNSVDSTSKEYFELAAMRLSRGKDFDYDYDSGKLNGILDTTDESLINELSTRIEWYKDLDELIDDSIDNDFPLLIATVKKIILNSSENSRLNIEDKLAKSVNIIETFSIEYPELISFYDDWSESAQENINKENVAKVISDTLLIENLVKIDNDLSKHVISCFTDHLELLSVEQWLGGLKDENSFYIQVVYNLIIGNKLKNIPDNLVSAYKEYLLLIAKGQIQIKANVSKNTIIEKINKNKLKPTIKNVRDAFINDINISPDIFRFFANMLIEDGKLEDKPDDVARRILTPVANDNECLKIILNNADYFSNIIVNAADDSSDIKDLIKRKLKTSVNDELLSSFAKRINIEIDQDEL
jgi:hypothetical protein